MTDLRVSFRGLSPLFLLKLVHIYELMNHSNASLLTAQASHLQKIFQYISHLEHILKTQQI